jgi:hypothetical protein
MRFDSEVWAEALRQLAVEQEVCLYDLPFSNSELLSAKRTLGAMQEHGWLSLRQDDPPIWGPGPVAQNCMRFRPSGERRLSERTRDTVNSSGETDKHETVESLPEPLGRSGRTREGCTRCNHPISAKEHGYRVSWRERTSRGIGSIGSCWLCNDCHETLLGADTRD